MWKCGNVEMRKFKIMEKLNDLTQKYPKGTIIIHWITALLILILFPLGKYVEELEGNAKILPLRIHAVLGLLILILTIIRVYFYYRKPYPEHVKTGNYINDKIVIWVNRIFYFLLFAISISGILVMAVIGYGDAVLAGDISLVKPHDNSLLIKAHGTMATLLMILFGLHVLGVIKHKILKNENLLKRMI